MAINHQLAPKENSYSLLMTVGTNNSGLQACFASLAFRFQENGISTTIFTSPGEQYAGLCDQLERCGCKVISDIAFSLSSKVMGKKAEKIILENVKTKRIVLLGFSIRSAMIFRNVSLQCKRKNIESLSFIQIYSLRHQSHFWPIFYLLGVRIYTFFVDHVFAACEIEKARMTKLGLPTSKCSVVHLPIDDKWTFKFDDSSDSITSSSHIPWLNRCSRPRIIFLGNFIPVKDQETLVRMMPHILTRFPSATLILAGEGPCKSKCENLAKYLGVSSSIIFPGRLPPKYIPCLLKQCDITVVASVNETFGYCIAEPLLYDIPVVSTNIGIAAELNKIGAIKMFKKKSPDDAAKQVIKCLEEPELTKKRSALGKEYILHNCLSGIVSEQMVHVWEALFNRER
jgi:glycosyltransferase involved in cell wall biosynthesis